MRVLGFDITRRGTDVEKAYTPAGHGGWVGLIREAWGGAWQTNTEIRLDNVLTFFAVYSCVSLISSDIAKLRVKLLKRGAGDIWKEVGQSAFLPVVRKPNHYQSRIQFLESWLQSKLIHGNSYVLKERDSRGVVTRLYVLDPTRVMPLVADDGAVFYQLSRDDLSGVRTQVTIPAREVIHDRWNTIHHPLVGTSPISACGLAAMQGLRIQDNSATFFANGSQPGGILSAPGKINDENARKIKEYWQAEFSGQNRGRIAVLSDGMTFQQMAITAHDAQLVEQLKWTAETIAGVFRVPAYKIGVAPPPTYDNIEGLNVQYYSQCLQCLIEAVELSMDEGLALGPGLRTELDLEGLLRMDTAALTKSTAEAVKAGIMAPNEARSKFDLVPVDGGESPYLQEQNWPLKLLADRELPARAPTEPTPIAEPPTDPDDADDEGPSADETRAALAAILRGAGERHRATAA